MVEIAQLSDSGQKVFEARYAAKDEQGRVTETFEQAVHRLARTTALAEKAQDRAAWEEKFAASIGGLLFVPSTPIWANIGKTDRPWQPGACFVLAVEDSLESMYQTLKDTAMVFKSGGGVGYNFSAIRPRGSMVRSTKGQASGVVELIRLYDASSGMVMQGGVRRGASMGILNIDHPEIIHFINSKRGGDITHFNLSVGVTDAFMEALERDEDWPLVFNGEVHQTVPARELWDLITESAHACGDPGIIFLDRLQRDNPVPEKKINATNPCVTGDTWVTTGAGPRQVRELVGRPFEAIVNGKAYGTGKDGFFQTGTKPVVKLCTREGYTVRLTADHMILRVTDKTRYRLSQEWVPAADLKAGDQIVLHNHRPLPGWPGALTEGEGYLLGLLVGDGTLKKETAILSTWVKKQAVNGSGAGDGVDSVMQLVLQYTGKMRHRADFTGWDPVKGRNEYRFKSAGIKVLAERMGLGPGRKTATPEIEGASSEGYRGFLRGLFDADGTIIGEQQKGVSIRLTQSNRDLLGIVQRMLARLGIISTIYEGRRPAGLKSLPDGNGGNKEYHIKAQHELVISRDNISVFAERIGFGNSEKAGRLKSLLEAYKRDLNRERFTATVLCVEEDGIEDVYDVQVPGINAFDANGIVAHNCGEQPLSPGESCLLGSVNLARMLKPGRDGYVVDWELLRDTVRLGIRFLDNLIDVAEYPLEFIAEATRATRKVGLGYTGLHDLLIKMGLPYDAEEGRRFAGTVFKAVQDAALAYSRELAGERGCFPEWERSVFHPHEKRRNAACITVAPTGSVTTIAGCEGYGIEPIFAVAYTKDTDVAGSFEVFSPLFLEACERLGVSREVMSEVARRGGCQGVEGVPPELARIFKGAQEISPRDHILMQAEVQKYVCNAVSKTINLPNSATIHDIETCYRLAYELGLKGVTVFRDGCKQGVVTVGRKKRKPVPGELARGEIMPRPENAQGVTHRLDSGCGKIYLTVNYHPATGEILETFITTGSDGGCLIYTEATSRLISLAIRGGIPLEEIIGQLQSTHACPSYQLARGRGRQLSPGKSCASAIARKLIEIQTELARRCNGGEIPAPWGVRNPDTEPGPDRCEVCGLRMNRAEGCYVCPHCGFAKC
ncbi:LAGLIDADG family homing endonuclease [Candidatus Desulforudis audaxviator]|uniref:Ribonucleoside-diphosphate reductase n=1 Tax=Desulforudis audaxviator (strain MP104C) TaxID=477974 RepID=B1I483_DESAP|nr:LAGLIDADG family homing endonuclease [Candidatus Desulforudis audaxviator]ACA59780.1 ribonucleoside-diphosphate reductase, adenosylcobalamin-dependent [Candidatus Desulforudis audaxviator MP104C]AZK59782.1 Ribonucleotide reductase of class II (coenzyme B12-dependent) [Candidatus Desulforudis audaxviator]